MRLQTQRGVGVETGLRRFSSAAFHPIGHFLARFLTPNLLTASSLAVSVVIGWCFMVGRFFLGAWLMLLAGLLDIFDGQVAKLTNRVSVFGAFFDSTVDRVVSATGQAPEMQVSEGDNRILGGDHATGEGTVAHAVASGKRGAFTVLKRLGLVSREVEAAFSSVRRPADAAERVAYDRLNPAAFAPQPRVNSPRRDPAERVRDFGEVVQGISPGEVRREAGRCFNCGTCTLCGTCWYFCPDACVIMDGPDREAPSFDLDYCKGCAVCSAVCPRGCIAMEVE